MVSPCKEGCQPDTLPQYRVQLTAPGKAPVSVLGPQTHFQDRGWEEWKVGGWWPPLPAMRTGAVLAGEIQGSRCE